jgi:hypothetical protein
MRAIEIIRSFLTAYGGHEKNLNVDPNSSPSSRVLGRCVHSVSGKKRAEMPPTTLIVPMMTRGRAWL